MHDEATAVALLDAAEKIVETEGLQALTVRRVAEETGTTTRAVYTSLGSKQALLGGLGVRAFDLLGAIVDGLPLTADPVADLVSAGTRGFRPFVLAHPALFRVGIQQTEVPSDAALTIFPAAERALAALHRRIARVQEAGRLGARVVPEAAWEFHAVCEGLAALELRCIIPSREGRRLWEDTLGALVTGWQHTRPSPTPAQTDHPSTPSARSKAS